MSTPDSHDPWAPPAGDGDPGHETPGRPQDAPGTTPGSPGGPSRGGGPAPFGAPAGPPPPRPPGKGLLPLAVLGVVAAFVAPPVGFAMCGVVVFLAVRARRRAAAAGTSAPGTVSAIALAVSGVVLPLLVLGLFYDEISTYTECTQRANTHQARDDCDAMLEHMLHRYVGG